MNSNFLDFFHFLQKMLNPKCLKRLFLCLSLFLFSLLLYFFPSVLLSFLLSFFLSFFLSVFLSFFLSFFLSLSLTLFLSFFLAFFLSLIIFLSIFLSLSLSLFFSFLFLSLSLLYFSFLSHISLILTSHKVPFKCLKLARLDQPRDAAFRSKIFVRKPLVQKFLLEIFVRKILLENVC